MLNMSPEVALASGILSILLFVVGLIHPPKDPGLEYFLAMGALGAYGLVSTVFGAVVLIIR